MTLAVQEMQDLRKAVRISKKIAAAEWGFGVVTQLAVHIAQTQPGLRGFTRPNLFRMRQFCQFCQFYEAYPSDEIVSPLVRQLPWTHNLIILSQSKRPEIEGASA